MTPSLFINETEVNIVVGSYKNAGLYIALDQANGYPYQTETGSLTYNTDSILPDFHAFIDTAKMPEAEDFIKNNQLGEPTGFIGQGPKGETLPLYMFYSEVLRAFDPQGVHNYENRTNATHEIEYKDVMSQEEDLEVDDVEIE